MYVCMYVYAFVSTNDPTVLDDLRRTHGALPCGREVCMYVCMCFVASDGVTMHAYIHTYIYIYIYIYTHTD